MNPEDVARARFRPLAKVYDKTTALATELQETRGLVERLTNEQTAAAHRDRLAYADALSKGEPRPAKREESKARAAREDAELKSEALAIAVDSALDERAKILDRHRSGWKREAMRELARARGRYEDAIAELEAARDALSNEASLIAWLDSGASADAASDPLGGRIGADAQGRQPLSFARTIEALRQDAANIAEYPVSHDAPAAELRHELAWKG
jgi:hypothetical protein